MAKVDTARGRRATLLIATRKGLWQLSADATRRQWRLIGPHFLGHVVHHCVADPRDAKTVLAAARTGHLGPTIFRSADRGRTWHEAKRPPAWDLLNLRLMSFDPERNRVVMEWQAEERHCHSVKGHPKGGIVQGGIVTGWLDAAMASACHL